MLVLGGAKFTTQLLSMLGIMGSTNIMVWHYGMMAGDVLMMVVGVMMFIAYNKAYGVAVAQDDATETSVANSLVDFMETEMTWSLIGQAAMHLELMYNYEGWLWGQVMMLPEEEQEAWMEKMDKMDEMDDMDDKDGDDDDNEMDLFAFWRRI